MKSGWIKLHRCLIDKAIWRQSTAEQKAVLITILLMADHSANQWIWNGKKFETEPGQFITSLDSLANSAGVSIRNVRTALQKFESVGFLTNQSTKTGRLIDVVNWRVYQGTEAECDKATDKELTKTRQRDDKELTTNKNVRSEEVKEEKNIYSSEFLKFWAFYPRKKEKAKAFRAWKTRLKEKVEMNALVLAAQNYANECRKEKRAEQYIKLPATFLGNDKPFNEYVGGDENGIGKQSAGTNARQICHTAGDDIYQNFFI